MLKACSAEGKVCPKTLRSDGKKMDKGLSFSEKQTISSCLESIIYILAILDDNPFVCKFGSIIYIRNYFCNGHQPNNLCTFFAFTHRLTLVSNCAAKLCTHCATRSRGEIYTKRFPLRISVIQWVLGWRIFKIFEDTTGLQS